MNKKLAIIAMLLTLFLCAGTALAETQLRDAYTFSGEPVRGEFVEGEVLVVLEAPAGISASNVKAFEASLSTSANSVAASIGAQAVQTYAAIAAGSGKNIVHMKAEGKTTEELLAALEGVPGVLGAAPNYIRRMSLLPNDPRYSDLWGMPHINAPGAWDVSVGHPGVFVAVIDTGIDYNHVDLAGNIGRDLDGNVGINTVTTTPFYDPTDPMDDEGHGTHVAGTIGAVGNNATGVVGVNWQVSLLGVKVLDSDGDGTDATIISGLNYVVAQKRRGLDIRVANMSLGGWNTPIANPATHPYGIAHKAVSDEGIVLVVAAGNENQDIDNPTGYLHPVHGWIDLRGKLPYPASFTFSNMITVASVASDSTRSTFSNYSPNYTHLAAPGTGIWSTIPGDLYASFNGTSMATPHVAGAAALIAAAHPQENAGQIKARILNNVAPNANLNGLVARNGHLNVNAAIRAGAPVPPPPPPGPVPVTGVTISPTTLNLAIGQSATLTATIIPANATNQGVTWWTSNRNIADVTPSGITATITGISAGTATITVRTDDGDFSATATAVVGGGGGDSGGDGCSIGAGAAIPAVLLLLVPLGMLLKRGGK